MIFKYFMLHIELLMVKLGCCSEEQTFTECYESELLFEMWKYLTSFNK